MANVGDYLFGNNNKASNKFNLKGVAKAYADSNTRIPESVAYKLRDLDYRGFWATPSKAKIEVGYIGRYNRFSPAEARRLISIKGVSKVRVAREGSPAIYFLTSNPEALLKARSTADEKRIVSSEGNKAVVRMWWD